METYLIKASNGQSYDQKAGSKTEAIVTFEESHPDLEVTRILNEDQAIMESLAKGFE